MHIRVDKEETDYKIFNIYFGGGSYFIDGDTELDLYEFLAQIEGVENYTITVHSHTDNIGGAAYNEWLSQMRSETAIDLLTNQNILQELISIKDFGQFNPVYDNSTWLGRMKNRRVDIIFWPIVM